MPITRKIKPLLDRLVKAEPKAIYTIVDRYGEDVVFTPKQYQAAKKVMGFLTDQWDRVDTDSVSLDDGDTFVVVDPESLKQLKKLLANPQYYYELSDGYSNLRISQDDYEKMGGEKVYQFTVHGYDAVLTAKDLKIGCQEHSLSGWDRIIDTLIERRYHYESDGLTDLMRKQYAEARPVFAKLQAKLKPKTKKKAKAKKAKTGR